MRSKVESEPETSNLKEIIVECSNKEVVSQASVPEGHPYRADHSHQRGFPRDEYMGDECIAILVPSRPLRLPIRSSNLIRTCIRREARSNYQSLSVSSTVKTSADIRSL